jgi:hypothetical protein
MKISFVDKPMKEAMPPSNKGPMNWIPEEKMREAAHFEFPFSEARPINNDKDIGRLAISAMGLLNDTLLSATDDAIWLHVLTSSDLLDDEDQLPDKVEMILSEWARDIAVVLRESQRDGVYDEMVPTVTN